MKSVFESVVGQASTFATLPEGVHNVVLEKFASIDSFTNHDGTKKDKQYPWADATPQAFLVVRSVDGKGSLAYRLNGRGFMKFAELSDEQVQSGAYENIEGYACQTNKAGKTVRTVSKKKTESAMAIFAEFLFATAGEGQGMDSLDEVIANKEEFAIKVVNKPYDNGTGSKDNFEIERFYPDTVEAKAAATKSKEVAVDVDLEEDN